MRPTTGYAAALISASLIIAGCSSSDGGDSNAQSRAVVIVSGGGATTPFTTPEAACSDADGFLSAGNTATGLRDSLLAQGKQVYTAPTYAGMGVVQEPEADSFAPFADCPETLPEIMTIMSLGDINAGGERLARFINHLNAEYGVTDVDLVGHSNGGLWSRSAIWVIKNTDSTVTIRSLTAMGTPNEGSVPGRFTWGEIDLDACEGVAFCEKFNQAWVPYADQGDKGINREDTQKYLMGPDGWNLSQVGALDGVPVTLMGGTYWDVPGGDPTVWPYDGITSKSSAWASSVPTEVIPIRSCWAAPLTHSIFVSDAADLDWSTALTWNTEALAAVNAAIDAADTAADQPSGAGCS
jgi:triacylglycerol lipase